MKRILVPLLGSLALLAASCGGSSDALANRTPKQVLASALAAAKTAGSFHFALTGKTTSGTESVIGDTSATASRESITIGSSTFQLEVIGSKAFVEGNAGGLQNEMGLPAAAAATYGGKWISVAATDAPYSSITKATTLATTMTDISPSGHLTLTATATRSGQTVVGVRGSVPGGAQSGVTGSAVIYVATAHPTLPIVYSSEATSKGEKETDLGTFSRWGEPVHIAVPTASVPLSSVSAAAG
jgi:hypothetical protein